MSRRDAHAHGLLPLGHEALLRWLPDLAPIIKRAVGDARQHNLATDGGSISVLRLLRLPSLSAWCDGLAEKEADGGLTANEVLESVGKYIHIGVNFELARRKVFWVDESLAFMLAHTSLDIEGRALEMPFQTFAIALQDEATLELVRDYYDLSRTLVGPDGAVVSDAIHEDIKRSIRALTIYVIRGERDDGGTDVEFFLVVDHGRRSLPMCFITSLRITPDASIDEVLESVGVDFRAKPDIFAQNGSSATRSPQLKRLLRIALNAILYATSAVPVDGWPFLVSPAAEVMIRTRGLGAKRQRRATTRASELRAAHSSESVFHLAGKIPISLLRELRAAERLDRGGQLFSRFMVRGHWRRPATTWADQRLRWIEPYWKGPELGTIIEREYRMTL